MIDTKEQLHQRLKDIKTQPRSLRDGAVSLYLSAADAAAL